jgi:hypothetical protein
MAGGRRRGRDRFSGGDDGSLTVSVKVEVVDGAEDRDDVDVEVEIGAEEVGESEMSTGTVGRACIATTFVIAVWTVSSYTVLLSGSGRMSPS